MNFFYFIKALNSFSIIFAISNFLFYGTNIKIELNTLIYLWMSILTFFLYINRTKKIRFLLYLLLIPPLFLSTGLKDVIFVLIMDVAAFYYGKNKLGELNKDKVEEGFVKMFLLVVALLFITYTSFIIRNVSSYSAQLKEGVLDGFTKPSAQYFIIYFITSIIIFRTVRFISNKISMNDSNKIIMVAIIILASTVLVSNYLQTGIVDSYNLMVDKLKSNKPESHEDLDKWLNWSKKYKGVTPAALNSWYGPPKESFPKGLQNGDFKELCSWDFLYMILDQFKIAFGIVLIYIFICLLRKQLYQKQQNIEEIDLYTEKREFIIKDNLNPSKLLKNVLTKLEPKENDLKIRYFYNKYLNFIKNNGVIIKKSDTTLDIVENSKELYDNTLNEKLRDIYLEARYTDKNIDDSKVNMFKEILKNVTKAYSKK